MTPDNAYKPPWWTKLSGFIAAIEYNRNLRSRDPETEESKWKQLLASSSPSDNYRRETISRAYDGATARSVRVEAKAVGLLQVIAIGFALVALVADHRTWVVRGLAVLAIAYLGLATAGALQLLRPLSRRQVVVDTASDQDGGLLATALATSSLEDEHPRMSNFLHGVLRDLVVGFSAALAALLMTIASEGEIGLL